ncbi:hypothetical protein Tco_1080880 [Tanacetum coccineum]|uniref:Uncharacterized protein n=1 Tax=Tanacetum coccineum TaxID=301880 RepID=A0ABQ5HW06_9ASTR
MVTQDNEIASLKRRVKKLEKKDRSRTHKLKRLYKVGLTARVESFGDEESLGEDASKQRRRINDIKEDEDITLVNVQDDADKEMFDIDTLTGDEYTLAQALAALKSVKPKAKGIAFRDPDESITTTTTIPSRIQDKGKGILVELEKPLKKKDQIKLDEEIAH